jgi:hypothetical protein
MCTNNTTKNNDQEPLKVDLKFRPNISFFYYFNKLHTVTLFEKIRLSTSLPLK